MTLQAVDFLCKLHVLLRQTGVETLGGKPSIRDRVLKLGLGCLRQTGVETLGGKPSIRDDLTVNCG